MKTGVIDKRGYRLNVGMVVVNDRGQLFWGCRAGMVDAWQFPQGGMLPGETPREAMYRELFEELGLRPEAVTIVEEMRDWVSYQLPKSFIRYDSKPLCIGQRQKWFLLRLIADDTQISVDQSAKQEFDRWCWVDYWYPLKRVISFKRKVYRKVLKSFEGLI